MTQTEQLTVLAIVAWVAYLVGTSRGQKAPANSASKGACTDCSTDTPATGDTNGNMDWFVNWSGLAK